jgi:hypothetical protein
MDKSIIINFFITVQKIKPRAALIRLVFLVNKNRLPAPHYYLSNFLAKASCTIMNAERTMDNPGPSHSRQRRIEQRGCSPYM